MIRWVHFLRFMEIRCECEHNALMSASGSEGVFVVHSQVFAAPGAMDDLLNRKRKLQEDLAAVGATIRRAKAKAKAAVAANARAWVLTGGVLSTVLVAYVLADGVVDPAVVFLKQKGRQFGWPEKTDDELAVLVDDVFLAADTEAMVALADYTTSPDKSATETAIRNLRAPMASAELDGGAESEGHHSKYCRSACSV